MAFIGINGTQANYDFTNTNQADAEIKSLFINSARQKDVLVDSSKIGRIALAKISEIKDKEKESIFNYLRYSHYTYY